MRKLKGLLIAALALPVALLGMTGGNAEAYTTQGVLGTYDFIDTRSISTSTTGRYITFTSGMSTLVSGDTNNKNDAFIKDTETGTVNLLSVTPSGASGNGHTRGTAIVTGNGRYVLFSSESSDLASTAGAYSRRNLYLRDLYVSTTYLIEPGLNGSNIDIDPVGLSEDGRFIYYTSYLNGNRLYVRDRVLNTTTRVDTDTAGNPSNNSYVAGGGRQVSCDGRFIVFLSGSTNLVSNDTNGVADVFLVDRMGGHSVKNVTLDLGSNTQNWSPKISCDGNYILFSSDASNLVSSDTNNARDLFRYSVSDGTVERVSLKDDDSEYSGDQNSVDGGFYDAGYDMSMDGRYIFYIYAKYTSTAKNHYLTMRDTKLGATSVIAPSGSNYYSRYPTVSFDGRKVYYIASTDAAGQFSPQLYAVTGHL